MATVTFKQSGESQELQLPEGATYADAVQAAGVSSEVFAVKANGVLKILRSIPRP